MLARLKFFLLYFFNHLLTVWSQDIRLRNSENSKKINSRMLISEDHIGNQYRFSLSVSLGLTWSERFFSYPTYKSWYYLQMYLSILYLRIPQSFSIILRGNVVEHHSIAHGLKYPEFIMYRPLTGGTKEVTYHAFYSLCSLLSSSFVVSWMAWIAHLYFYYFYCIY